MADYNVKKSKEGLMMAKKKAKKVEKVEPKKASKKKTNATAWVVGVVIVIVIIIAIILLLRGVQKQAEQPTPTKPAETPKTTAGAAGPELVSEVPEEVRYCSIDYAIGWPKNKLGDPCTIDGNKVNAQIMFSGKGDSLKGLWFKVTTADGKVKYLKDSREIKQGEIKQYSIDAGQKIEDLLALPIISEGGVDKSCLNQRMLVIKAEQCVAG